MELRALPTQRYRDPVSLRGAPRPHPAAGSPSQEATPSPGTSWRRPLSLPCRRTPRTPSPRAHYTGPCSVPRLAHSSASGRLRVPILTPSSPPAAAQQRKDANLIAPPPPSARTSAGPSPLLSGQNQTRGKTVAKQTEKNGAKVGMVDTAKQVDGRWPAGFRRTSALGTLKWHCHPKPPRDLCHAAPARAMGLLGLPASDSKPCLGPGLWANSELQGGGAGGGGDACALPWEGRAPRHV